MTTARDGLVVVLPYGPKPVTRTRTTMDVHAPPAPGRACEQWRGEGRVVEIKADGVIDSAPAARAQTLAVAARGVGKRANSASFPLMLLHAIDATRRLTNRTHRNGAHGPRRVRVRSMKSRHRWNTVADGRPETSRTPSKFSALSRRGLNSSRTETRPMGYGTASNGRRTRAARGRSRGA